MIDPNFDAGMRGYNVLLKHHHRFNEGRNAGDLRESISC